MRRRYVLINGELVEITGEPSAPLCADSGALWGDTHYDGLTASDGTPIDTRAKHRAYMKERGLTTMDDFKVQWENDAKRRAAELGGRDPSRKHDIADVVYNRRPLVKPRGREGDPL